MNFESVFIKSEPQDDTFNHDTSQDVTEIISPVKSEVKSGMEELIISSFVKQIDETPTSLVCKNELESSFNSLENDTVSSKMYVEDFLNEGDNDENSSDNTQEIDVDVNIEGDLSGIDTTDNHLKPTKRKRSSRKKTFTCEFCDKILPRKVKFESHLLKQHRKLIENNLDKYISYKIHKCSHCKYETIHSNHLKAHINSNHNDNRTKIQCKFCEKSFIKKIALDDHLVKQHSELIMNHLDDYVSNEIIKCNDCAFMTTHRNKLKIHMEAFHNESRSKTNCHFCDKPFLSKSSLQDHLLKQHNSDIKSNFEEFVTSKVHKCEHCDFETTQKPSLVSHLSKTHKECNMICDYCDRTFSRKYSLHDHLLKQHKDQIADNLEKIITSKIHTCMFCDFETTRKGCLNIHLKNFHSELNMKLNCEFCTKTFVHKYSLDSHLLNHHYDKIIGNLKEFITSKIYKCEKCAFVTSHKNTLTRHNESHQK